MVLSPVGYFASKISTFDNVFPLRTPPRGYAYQTTCYFSLWLRPAETRAYNQNDFVTKMGAAFW